MGGEREEEGEEGERKEKEKREGGKENWGGTSKLEEGHLHPMGATTLLR